MKFQFFLLIFFSAICVAAEKKVTINPNAPKVWVPDENTYYQSPVTPEIETENLFESYNQNRREIVIDNRFNIVLTAAAASSCVASVCIPDGADETTKTWKRATIVTSFITLLVQSFRTCRDCRKKPKNVANYSRTVTPRSQIATPRHFYPETVSKGPSPFSQTRTLE